MRWTDRLPSHQGEMTQVSPRRSATTTPTRARAALFMGIAALFALLPLAPPSFAEESRMTGRVIDAETQAPIAEAEVELTNTGGGSGFYRARTDRNGEFALRGVIAERYYSFTVSAAGYADFVLGGWRFPAAQRAVDVQVPLDRAGSIEVRVTAADGRTPIASARVSVRSESPSQWWEGYRPPPAPVFTDAKGVTPFAGLTAGYWTVIAEASGRLTSETRRVAVRRGEITRVPVELARPASISGVVRLADGTGVAGIGVIARGPTEGAGTTDAEGNFTVSDLAPGRYRLEAQPDGFQPARAAETATLAEGQSRAGNALIVTPRDPELSFVLHREVFAPDEMVKVGMRSFRIGQVALTLWRIPIERLLDPARDFRDYASGADTTGLVRERTWTHTTPAGSPFAWREEEVTVAEEPAGGVYVLSGRAGDTERRILFFVSELGLVVKRSATQILVSAASLKTAVPAQGVAVFTTPAAAGRHQIQAGQGWQDAMREAKSGGGATDAEGLLEILIGGAPQRVRVVGVHERLGVAVVESPLAAAAEQGGDQIFLHTERPIYRPGQTMYWKAFARRAAGNGYSLPDATQTTLVLRGPDGSTLNVPPVPLSAHGSADGVVELPRDLALGDWSLEARAGKAAAVATFGVQEYRKPEFGVEVEPDREVYVNGDEVRFRVAATYFFGAPVFGATVRYNLFESRIRRDGDWDEWDLDQVPEVGFGRVLKTGEARTDADGRVALAFVPERVSYDRRLTLEVEIVDGANRRVRGRGSAVMGRGLFIVSARPVNRLVPVGEPILIEVRTVDHTGKPVAAAVTVELDQDAWNPIERRHTRSTRPLASRTVTTDATGRAGVSLVPAPVRSGNLTVRARAEDAQGNRITDESSVWVYDPQVWQYAYRYPALEAFADQPRYQPGDTARIVINTDVGHAAVLATLEGRRIAEYRIVHLFGNTGLVEFPIRAEYAPNVYVSLHVRKGKEVRTRVLDLAVAGARHDLKIEIRTDREQYRPGDEAQVSVTTRDGTGAPAPAELSLGVVDEAIYALRPDRTPDPHQVFYGHRPNWVTTSVSFPALYLGGASKDGQEEVRRDFRDVAFWAPALHTDAQGWAGVTFRFPDNLTTWRLTGRGATDDTRVGAGVAKTRVTKDLVARLATPRFFVAGDAASLVSVVTNRTAEPLVDVDQSIEAKGPIRVTGPSSAKASIPGRGESRQEWSVEAARDLSSVAADTVEATFVFRARAQSDSDALEMRTPVRPRAVPLISHGAGALESASAVVGVNLPADLIRNGSEVRIDLSASPAAMLVAAADGLHAYEWTCTEQTANALRSAAAMLAALGRADARPAGWEDPARKLAPAIRRLIALQGQDGTWGWWGGGDGTPYMTALALDALARVAALQLQTEDLESPMQRAGWQVPRLLYQVRTLDGEAYMLAHLVRMLALPNAKDRFPELRARLEELALATHAGRDRLSTAGLALAALGHSELDRTVEAKALLELLVKRATGDAGGLHWPTDPELADGWFGDAEENTGYALAAMMAIEPGDRRADSVVQWLAHRRRGPLWRSTRETGPVAIGLGAYVEKRPAEARPAYRLKVDWNGATLLDRDVTRADLGGSSELRFRIPGRSLRPGANRLALTRRGTGSVFYAWEARSMVPSPGPVVEPGPLQITRELLHAERTADRRGRPRILATPREANQPFRVGEQVMVRIRLRATRPLRHLIVEEPRLAGFEIDALLPEGAEWPWGTHAEERDDRVALFLERIEEGETVLEYLVRPEIAGTFTGLPATASGMYDPDLEARSGELRVEVRGR